MAHPGSSSPRTRGVSGVARVVSRIFGGNGDDFPWEKIHPQKKGENQGFRTGFCFAFFCSPSTSQN